MERENAAGQRGNFLAVSLIRGVTGPGLNSCLGIFFPAVAASLGVGIGTLSIAVSVASVAGLLCLTPAERLYERWGVRGATVVGALLVALPFMVFSFGRRPLWWMLLSVPFGIGTVMLVSLLGPLSLGHGSTRIGGSLGGMMLLSGLAAAVMQPFFTFLISRFGWRNAYLVGGVAALGILLLSTYFLLPIKLSPPQEHEEGRTGNRLVLSMSAFFLGVIAAFNAFHQHMAVCGESLGFSVTQVGRALFLSMLGAAFGGVLIGWVSHLHGAVSGGVLAAVVGVGSLGLFLLGEGHIMMFYLACTLHGVSSASIGITAQAVARESLGDGYNRGVASLMRAVPLATVVATPLYGFIYDLTGSYRMVWWILGGLLIMSLTMLVYVTRMHRHATL